MFTLCGPISQSVVSSAATEQPLSSNLLTTLRHHTEMAAIFSWLPLLLRRRKRVQSLADANSWPIISARLLKSTVVPKDPLAEGGTAVQDFQIESAFYFTHEGAYYGGHLRSTPLSDSEAHRAIRNLPEELPVLVRYNPHNPDQTHTLATDNQDFPVLLWPS